jgi:hypothetical protein
MRLCLGAVLLTCGAFAACSERSAVVAPATATSAPAELPVAADTAAAPETIATTSASVVASVTANPTPSAVASVAAGGAAEPTPCPEGMARVQRFCIDRFEAQLWAPGPDGVLAPLPHNQRPPQGVRFEARSLPDVLPQAYINRIEAAAACKNAGKRLCSMREWRRACEGRGGAHWPYGHKGIAGRCNHEKPHLLSIKFGPDARRWKYEMFNDPSLNVEPGFLAKTGEYAGCATPEDVHDLVGNLHEWVSDMVDAELVAKMDAEEVERRDQPWKEGNGVFMGGFFSTADQHGPGCTFTTIAHEPRYHDYSIGFRCCAAALLPEELKRPQKSKK